MIPLFAAMNKPIIKLSGSLSASAAGSPVTSATVTVTVPGGSSGNIRFDNVSLLGLSVQYQKNGGASPWTAITEDLVVNFANGDTLAVRASGSVGALADFDVVDDGSGRIIQTVNITRV